MEKIKTDGDRASFLCPGCGMVHSIPVEGPAAWTWNGSVERPTFQPSILVRSGHYAPGWKDGEACWCTFNRAHPEESDPFICYVCHSFVEDGRIQFLNDSTHALAGKTVEISEWK